jgi:hypothetical protein
VISESSLAHADCHWVGVRLGLSRRRSMSCWIESLCVSNSRVLKVSILSCGIGLGIRDWGAGSGGGGRERRVWAGMCNMTGRWSEFRCIS